MATGNRGQRARRVPVGEPPGGTPRSADERRQAPPRTQTPQPSERGEAYSPPPEGATAPSSEKPQKRSRSQQTTRSHAPVRQFGLHLNSPKWGRNLLSLLALIVLLIISTIVLGGTLRLGTFAILVIGSVLLTFLKFLDPKYPLPQKYPKRRVRGIYWKLLGARLYSRLDREVLAKLSWRERDYNSRRDIWENRDIQKTLGFFNSKGGSGKTTGATWFAVVWAFFTKRHIVAMDVNHGPGGTATNLGVDPNKTMQLREFLELCVANAITSYEKFATLVDWHHEADVSVIASESRSNKPLWDHLMCGLTVAKSVSHGLVCDVGNSIELVNDLATVYKTDTPVFVANLRTGKSMKDMAATMQEYCNLGFSDKVSKSIVVIFGGKLRHRKRFAKSYERFGIALDQVFVVPFNRYMQNSNTDPDSDDTKIVSRMKVPLKVRVTLQEALLAAITAELSSDEVSEEVLRTKAVHMGPATDQPTLKSTQVGND